MQFFLPNKTGPNPEHLKAVGLEELLREGDTGPGAVDLVNVGPDGASRGAVFFWPNSTKNPGFHPESQAWSPCKPDPVRNLPAGRFWLGFDKAAENLPTAYSLQPTALQRSAACRLDGYPVTLSDGNEWIVPNGMLLPWRMTLDHEGKPSQRPKRQYEKIHEKTLWAFQQGEKLLRDGIDPDWQQAAEYAAFMLSLNYRVNLEICLTLELFDCANLGQLLARSTDVEKLMAIAAEVAEKKSALTPPG